MPAAWLSPIFRGFDRAGNVVVKPAARYIRPMSPSTKKLVEQVESWPAEDQEEPAEYACEIEARRSGVYRATTEELQAIDEAERSGTATDEEVEAVFQTFRRP
jgi:hypothetical protein